MTALDQLNLGIRVMLGAALDAVLFAAHGVVLAAIFATGFIIVLFSAPKFSRELDDQ